MPISIRKARQGNAAECGRVIFEAFKMLADLHGFPPDFPSVEAASGRCVPAAQRRGVPRCVSISGTSVRRNPL